MDEFWRRFGRLLDRILNEILDPEYDIRNSINNELLAEQRAMAGQEKALTAAEQCQRSVLLGFIGTRALTKQCPCKATRGDYCPLHAPNQPVVVTDARGREHHAN